MDNLATLEVIFDKIKLAKTAQAEASATLASAQIAFDKAREDSDKATAELSALVTQLNTTCGVMTTLVATPTVVSPVIAKSGTFAAALSANATPNVTPTVTSIMRKPKVTSQTDKTIRHCNYMKGRKDHCDAIFRVNVDLDEHDHQITFCPYHFKQVVGRGDDWVDSIIADSYIQ